MQHASINYQMASTDISYNKHVMFFFVVTRKPSIYKSYTCVVLSNFRLPGEAFVRRVHVWLCGANKVDSKVFSRAILARVHIPSPFFSIFFFKERCRSWYCHGHGNKGCRICSPTTAVQHDER